MADLPMIELNRVYFQRQTEKPQVALEHEKGRIMV